ncbi:uncharacterized protein BDR25DRAFT_356077 [Lindgomyces ingoldianus]|uniref:Uncharacterized protein n=1 Tax=Lindgomyces ingoldianus TaxID=673940 RepID=A0ACB6QSH2_9PLEO|nr:uncharacterized protein BDR25DRAFT_356077 [Lindgomyces ingoldianus]KAF2469830.1 hypothetical protein BDR25DRAFT_356077 [Lindgomyces ingoldianus]
MVPWLLRFANPINQALWHLIYTKKYDPASNPYVTPVNARKEVRREYIALAAVQSTMEFSDFLIGPKAKKGVDVPSAQFHVKDNPICGDVRSTNTWLTHIAIAKLENEYCRIRLLRNLLVVNSDPSRKFTICENQNQQMKDVVISSCTKFTTHPTTYCTFFHFEFFQKGLGSKISNPRRYVFAIGIGIFSDVAACFCYFKIISQPEVKLLRLQNACWIKSENFHEHANLPLP